MSNFPELEFVHLSLTVLIIAHILLDIDGHTNHIEDGGDALGHGGHLVKLLGELTRYGLFIRSLGSRI